MKTKKQQRAEMTASILTAALDLARAGHYSRVTRADIAARCNCAPSLVSHYYPTMAQLQRAVISAAIARENLPVLAQALAARESKALAAPDALKRAAAESLL